MANEGKYIYCIIETKGKAEQFGAIGIGGRGDPVHTIGINDIAAVVSDAPIKPYSVARENLIFHECAIEEVMKSYVVLPVRFATLAENEDKVRKILGKEHNRFVDLLRKMEGKKELGLKAVFKEGIIYKEILDNYDEIRNLKEKMAKEPGREFALLAIGRQVEAALEEEKRKCKEYILDTLMPLALEVKINNTYGERMILNAAFLVGTTHEALFDGKVNDLADRYGHKVIFKYIGYLPPFNFINLVINVGDY